MTTNLTELLQTQIERLVREYLAEQQKAALAAVELAFALQRQRGHGPRGQPRRQRLRRSWPSSPSGCARRSARALVKR
jgi:hypothetical protein